MDEKLKDTSWQKRRGIFWASGPFHHSHSWSCFYLSYPRWSLHGTYWCSWWTSSTRESGMPEGAQASALLGWPLAQGKETHFPHLSTSHSHLNLCQSPKSLPGSRRHWRLSVLKQSSLIPSRYGLSDKTMHGHGCRMTEKSISVLDYQREGRAQAGLAVWKVSFWWPLQRVPRECSSLPNCSWRVDSQSIYCCGYSFKRI